jgi:hypothetical protein
MDRKDTPSQHWDREQWAPDNPGPDATDQDATWNRQQMEVDNTGTEREGLGREGVDLDTANDVDEGTADMDAISGRGKPSGESHWGRTDRTEG